MHVLCMDGGDTVMCGQTLQSSPKGEKSGNLRIPILVHRIPCHINRMVAYV